MPKGFVSKTAGKHYQGLIESAKSRRYSNEQVFKKDSTYNRGHLKNRILKENLIENKCAFCEIENEWQGKPIVLHLDHINGDSFDNRLENLRFLCPNCHSQTETYSKGKGKNNRGRKKEILAKEGK